MLQIIFKKYTYDLYIHESQIGKRLREQSNWVMNDIFGMNNLVSEKVISCREAT